MSVQTSDPNIDFQVIVDEYYQPLYRFAFSLSKNEAEAGDLTQQTFLIWAQKGSSLRDTSKVKTWLFTTLYREFLRIRRRSSRFIEQESGDDYESELPAVESNIVNTLDAQQAMRALQEIDEAFRIPLAMFYIQDLSYKEIAEVMDLPIGTIMSRLSRGKAQLKKILTQGRSA